MSVRQPTVRQRPVVGPALLGAETVQAAPPVVAAGPDLPAQRLLALHEAALAIGAGRDTGQSLELILEQACRLVGAPAGDVYLWDEAHGTLRHHATHEASPDPP